VGQLAQRCRKLKIRCIGLAGMVGGSLGTGAGSMETHALTELTTVAQAKAKPAYWLERLARQAAGFVHDSRGKSVGPKSEGRSPKSEGRPKTEIRK
jgi:hypothetical protein